MKHQVLATQEEKDQARALGEAAATTSDRHTGWSDIMQIIGSQAEVGELRTIEIMDEFWAAQSAAREIEAQKALAD